MLLNRIMEHRYYRIQEISKSYPRFKEIIDGMRNPDKKIRKCFVVVDLLEYSRYSIKINFYKEEKHFFQTQCMNYDNDEYISQIYYDDPNVNLIIIYEDNTITVGKEFGNYYRDYVEKTQFIESDFTEEVWKQIKQIKID